MSGETRSIWHDVEALLREQHGADDDTFKGSAKDIQLLFWDAGWRPATGPPFVSRWVRRLRWRLRSRRCVCGQMRLAGDGSTAELAGVKHRTDGPCFHCDTYGNPL